MYKGKWETKKALSKGVYYGLLAFFGLIFVCSALYIGKYIWGSLQAGSEYQNLQHEYVAPSRPAITEPSQSTDPTGATDPTDSSEPTQPTTEPTEPTATQAPVYGPDGRQVLEELASFYEKNNELVGWISLPGTKLNYPVLQSPTRPDYYLNHTFEGKKSDWGAIYVRESCDVFAPTDNVTIYGHHMKDGSMFTPLDKYKKKSFWEDNQYIYFDTLYERHTYQVIAVFKTSANPGEGLTYHSYENFSSAEQFDAYIASVKALSKEQYYDTGLTAQYGDKLITLSTCEYTENNGRFVVIAKRVA